jgi:very-short-patch-repair endonuclease
VHRASVPPDERVAVGGLWVTSPRRTVTDCARILSATSAVVVADSALRLGLLTADELTSAAVAMRGPGSVAARAALLSADDRSESALESVARLLFRSHGLAPELQVSIYQGGEFLARVDALFRAERLVIELDGYEHHSSRGAFQTDRRRQNALLAAGYRVARFTWDDVWQRPDYVIRVVRTLVAAGP